MESLSLSDSPIVRIVDRIKKSDIDKWNYRGLELSNGMLCVLVNHESLDKAAVAISVSVGVLADRKDIPGVAHFVEHMLFMGSTKYPNENEFKKFIESNGGNSNAFTDARETNYHFDINPNALADVLDIFAQFFISPLFSSSSIDREVQAVHSEFEKNLSLDYRRIIQIEKFTSDPEHPFSRFTTGNIESLQTVPKQMGIDIRQVLIDFYEKHYSANRMSLVVLSNHSLDELQSFVVNSFKTIPNKQLIAQKYSADPYGPTTRKICYVEPIAEFRLMSINWVIPDYHELYYCNPGLYLSFLMSHQGKGSLFSHVKKRGFASRLLSYSRTQYAPGFNFFTIEVELTIEGLKRWDEIIVIIYQYMAMLRKEGPQKRIFDERKNMRMMNFQFAEKESPYAFVKNLASEIRDYPLTDCLFGGYDLREFRPDLICHLLNEYLIPSKMKIFLFGKEFTTIATEKEKWYGIKYKQEDLSDDLIKKCETNINIDDFYLPLPNDFIPTNFELYHNDQNITIKCPQLPIKIQENEYFRLYYAEDRFYKLPKVFLYFNLSNSLVNIDPIHRNMNSIYVELVKDSLSDLTYPARLAGLKYNLSTSLYGIELSINGYNHKTCILFEKIIDRMMNFKIDQQRFEIFRELRKQNLKNFHTQESYSMAKCGINYLTAEYQWNNDELLSCVDEITSHDMEIFKQCLFTRFYVDSFMYGNLTKSQAIDYMRIFQEKFHKNHLFQPLFPNMWFTQRHLMLPEGCNFAYTMLNDGSCTNAIHIFLQCFQQNLENNALINLFSHLIHEACFNQLRTKEQLGYIVQSGVYRIYGAQGIQIIIQSTSELDYLNQRIELFLDSIREYIEQMSDDEFRKQRDAFIIKSTEIPKSMEDQGDEFWGEITSHQFCFNRPQLESEIVKTFERNDLIQFYDHYISPRSLLRRKLMVFVRPSSLSKGDRIISSVEIIETENQRELNLPKIQWIENILVWKRAQLSDKLIEHYHQKSAHKDELFLFPAFTSTSRNRKKAEQFGNVLFIIEISEYDGYDVAPYSNYDEEEQLIKPSFSFYIRLCDFDEKKNKWIIHLKSYLSL
ncbi:hypothetical protein I4U23_005141 [Adineta vaga]|nr:hypothetical protein I4U23_005141 [Adineta vaga]